MKRFLLSSGNPKRDTVVWNAVSACLTSFQTMLLLMVLTRAGTEEHSGAFVMAYTVANLMMNIGKFGARQYQVTDAGEKYRYIDYTRARVFSMGLMSAALCGYLAWSLLRNGYSAEKAATVALISLFRGIEAAEDVMHGRMQQKGRLDTASKILAIRNLAFMLGFAVGYLLTRDLVLTCVVNVGVSLGLCFWLNGMVMPVFKNKTDNEKKPFPWGLVKECIPLCLTMVTYMYLGNAPKYIVDGLVTDAVQTRFNIVIMPAFVVSLLCTFIFNPVLKNIGELWHGGRIAELRRLVRKLALAPVVMDVAVLCGGWLLGVPVLEMLYGVELAEYRTMLMAFLLASGVVAMLNLFVALLTAMRKQRHLLYAYIAGSGVLLCFGKRLFMRLGLNVLCWSYLVVLLGVLGYCTGVYLKTVRTASRNRAEQ